MGKFIDLTGQKFNKLTVIKKCGKDKHGNILWECKCDCGSDKVSIVRSKDLKIGAIKSCGCLGLETIKELQKINTKHEKCTIENCNNKHYSLGYCEKHYKEFKKYGHIRSEEEIKVQKQEIAQKLSEKNKQNYKCQYCNNKGYYNKQFQLYLCDKHRSQLARHQEILERTRFDSNEYIIFDEHAEIVLYDSQGSPISNILIDLDDLEICKIYKWHSDSHGYAQTCVGKKRIKLHNYLMNPPKGMVVDHKNRNRQDNRRSNLRICTRKDNNKNYNVKKSSKTGIRGIEKLYNKFYAYIGVDGKKIHLGGYNNIEDAIKARLDAEIKYFGEFAPHLYDKNNNGNEVNVNA